MSKFDRNRIKDGWDKLCTNKQTDKPTDTTKIMAAWPWTKKQVVKVIGHKATSLLHTDGSILFARWHQCAHVTHASFAYLSQVGTKNGILISSAGFAQLIRVSSGIPSPSILPLPMGELYPRSNSGSSYPPDTVSQTASVSVQLFLHSSARVSVYFTMGPFAPQNCPFPLGDKDWRPSNNGCLGRVLN